MSKFIEFKGFYININDIAYVTPPKTISGSYSHTLVFEIQYKQGGKLNIEGNRIYEYIIKTIDENCEVFVLASTD